MNHLNHCFHCWYCASGSQKNYLLPCSNGILLQDLSRLYVMILNTVVYRDPDNGSLARCPGQVSMPHKPLGGKFKVLFWFNCCLDDQFRSASFDLQWLILWIVFTRHTAMAYEKWELRILHRLMKSTRSSLPSPRWPSTIVSRPGKQVSLGSRQSLVQEVQHNVSTIQETFITESVMHAQMYFSVSMRISILPRQRFESKWSTIAAAWFAQASTQLVLTQQWHNVTMISVDEEFLDYVPGELIEQPNNSFNRLSSFVAATEASMWFAAVLPMGGSAIASSSQPIPCSNSNSNSNNITRITNMTSVEHTRLIDGSMFDEGAMSLRSSEYCQWSDIGFPLCAILVQVSWIYHNSSKCNWTHGLLKFDLKQVKS